MERLIQLLGRIVAVSDLGSLRVPRVAHVIAAGGKSDNRFEMAVTNDVPDSGEGADFSQLPKTVTEPKPPVTLGRTRRVLFMNLAMSITDLCAVVASFAIGYALYWTPIFEGMRYRSTYDPTAFFILGAGTGIFVVLTFGFIGLYSRGVGILNVEETVQLVKGILFSGIVAFALSFTLRDHPIPRIALVLSIVVTFVTIPLGRKLVRTAGFWILSSRKGGVSVIIIGAGDTGKSLADRMLHNPQFGLKPVGFIDDLPHEDGMVAFGPGKKSKLPHLGSSMSIIESVKDTGAQALIIAIPKINSDHLRRIQHICSSEGIACHYVPLFASGPFKRLKMTFIGDIPIVAEHTASTRLTHRVVKRIFDAAVSSVLLVVFSPVFLITTLAIKLTSTGPVFFKQGRAGRGGRTFTMYKFRTMHTDAPAYADKPQEADSPRIYPLGRLMRKTSIDELPQLYNVLKGEMSLVGPRPEMPQIVEHYDEVQRERLLAAPGMTGLWQISADRGTPIHENTEYDLYYIYNQSFLLDFVILARTAFCLLSGR